MLEAKFQCMNKAPLEGTQWGAGGPVIQNAEIRKSLCKCTWKVAQFSCLLGAVFLPRKMGRLTL